MSNPSPIRLAVAGAGIAVRELHWPAIQALGDQYSIVALAARSEKSLKETGELVGCDRYFRDYQQMVREMRHEIDAVLISLPIPMLYEATAFVVAEGLDVLCEKPVGQNLAEGEAFAKLGAESDVSIQILENFRYRDDLWRARALIDEGAIGELFMVRVASVQHSDPSQGGYAGTAWRQQGKYAGGPLLDNGVHHMAAFHVLAGPAASVSGAVASTDPDYEGVDNALFTIRFQNGVLGDYLFSYSAFEEPEEQGFFAARCYGTRGSLLITDGQIRLLTTQGEQEPIRFPDFDNGYRNEFADFARHKTEGTPLRVTPREAFADLHLVLSGLDAARQGRVLEINPQAHTP